VKLGLVCRFRPVHLAHEALLEALVELAGPSGELVLGVGSSNRYDRRSPFTAAETRAMLRAVLGDRPGVTLVDVPDLGDGPRWAAMVAGLFGPLDRFVTANGWVASLLAGTYALAHPRDLVPRARHLPVSGTLVRRAMARGEPWRHLVPPAVAALLERDHLVDRFRREFGLSTLALETDGAPARAPTLEQEKDHVLLG
jgi:nicotinamide-nucleotide adenylyltransferase